MFIKGLEIYTGTLNSQVGFDIDCWVKVLFIELGWEVVQYQPEPHQLINQVGDVNSSWIE